MRGTLTGRRVYLSAVAVIAIATAVGLVALWPHGEVAPLKFTEGTNPGHAYAAEVRSIAALRCAAAGPEECQRVSFELKDGPDQGEIARVDLSSSAAVPDYSVGDELRVAKNELFAGTEPDRPSYTILDFERKAPLLWLSLAFGLLVVVFGRWRGALSLLGLAISLVVVLVFVVPALLRGSSPLAVALVGSMAVMLTTVPLAHGLGPKSLAAIAGTAVSLLLVVALAVLATHLTHLTGLASEQSAVLAFNNEALSLRGLLIAGMVIGSLGVLDDVTISQASTVMALRRANPRQHFPQLYRRAIEVGRDHVSATVNTLVLAYVGSSLPVLLIFGSGQLGALDAVNLEVVASVIVATLVGSIGLICAVPITTALAALLAESVPAEELVGDADAAHAH